MTAPSSPPPPLEATPPALPTVPKGEMLAAIAAVSPIPVIVTHEHTGEILYCNAKLAQLVGLSTEELVGRRTPDFYADPADRRAVLNELKQTGRVRDHEVRLKASDGTFSWAIFAVEPIRVAGQTLLVTALYDVTSRKEVEERLQESESRFRGYVENASDLVLAFDRQLKVTYVSPNAVAIIGYGADQMMGKTLDTWVHANDLPSLWDCAERTKESGRPQPSFEFRMRHKDGSTRWFCSALSPLKNARHEVVGLTGSAHDLTQEKAAIENLENANRRLRNAQVQLLESEKMASLGMLMAGIAHEIRTPMAAVYSTQETISRALDKLQQHLKSHHKETVDDPKVACLLEVLTDSARVVGDGSRRVTGIVKRLRQFSCSDETKPEVVDVNAILKDTLTLIHHELKHHVLVSEHLGANVSIVGYPSRLNQVFVNLLVNASHAIRAKGRGSISLATTAFKDHVQIEVTDDGIGIAADDLPRIFTSGFTTKKSEGGSGLGLAISKEIVEAHRGRIDVRSTVGVGTTFTIRLPRRWDGGVGCCNVP